MPKSIELYTQILLKVSTKVVINSIHLAWMKVIKIMKALFPTKLRKYITKFCRQSSQRRRHYTKFSEIFWSFPAFYSIKRKFMVLNQILSYSMMLNDNHLCDFGVLILRFYVSFDQLLDSFGIQKFWPCNTKMMTKYKKINIAVTCLLYFKSVLKSSSIPDFISTAIILWMIF